MANGHYEMVNPVGVIMREIADPRIVYERRKVSLISAQTKRWQKWAERAEVVHVAQEGGEG